MEAYLKVEGIKIAWYQANLFMKKVRMERTFRWKKYGHFSPYSYLSLAHSESLASTNGWNHSEGVAAGVEVRRVQKGAVAERAMDWMIPARWEGAGAGLSWITMTKQRKENTHTRTHVTALFCWDNHMCTRTHILDHITNRKIKLLQCKCFSGK